MLMWLRQKDLLKLLEDFNLELKHGLVGVLNESKEAIRALLTNDDLLRGQLGHDH